MPNRVFRQNSIDRIPKRQIAIMNLNLDRLYNNPLNNGPTTKLTRPPTAPFVVPPHSSLPAAGKLGRWAVASVAFRMSFSSAQIVKCIITAG